VGSVSGVRCCPILRRTSNPCAFGHSVSSLSGQIDKNSVSIRHGEATKGRLRVANAKLELAGRRRPPREGKGTCEPSGSGEEGGGGDEKTQVSEADRQRIINYHG